MFQPLVLLAKERKLLPKVSENLAPPVYNIKIYRTQTPILGLLKTENPVLWNLENRFYDYEISSG